MTYEIQGAEGRLHIAILARRPALLLAISDTTQTVQRFETRGDSFTLQLDGRTVTGWRSITSSTITIRLEGQTFVFQRLTGLRAEDDAAETTDDVKAAMPGVVVALHAAPGSQVARGDPLLTIESMKLQMTIAAPRAGTVARIHAAENATFDRGAVLVSLEPLP